MKVGGVLLLAALAVLAAATQGGKGKQMDKAALISLVRQVGQDTLGLKPVACVEAVNRGREGVSCYAAPYDADEFGRRVKALKDFKNLTGWRDDYGVLSGVFQYQAVPREVGFIYTRPNSFWKGDGYKEVRAAKAQGYVVLIVTDDDPKDF